MKPRRLALTLGAGGGVLAAAFLQPAVALADAYNFTPDPTSTEFFTSIGGLPPFDQTVTGYQDYNVDDLTTGATGSFNGVSFNGLSDQEILVANSLKFISPDAGTVSGTGAVPPQGSIFETFNYGSGFSQVYSDVVGTNGGANTITDTFVTPFGNVNIPTSFDATDALAAAKFTYPTGSTDAGDSYVPDSTLSERVTSLSGSPNFEQLVSGTQYYDVNTPAGNDVGNFSGVSLNDVYAWGQTNQEILVTPSALAVARAQPLLVSVNPNDPTIGSVFDTDNYGNGFENVYSDVVGTGGAANTITDTFQTPFGNFNIPTTFDAAEASSAAHFSYPTNSPDAGYSYVADPNYSEQFNSIDSTPLVEQTDIGRQYYDVDNSSGTTVGNFEGISSNSISAFGITNQEILVTPNAFAFAPYDATAVNSDAPGAGSFFDTLNFGNGFENVYSDVLGAGGTGTVTDTFVTPFGDLNLPFTFAAADALPAAEFATPAASAAADLASALNPADLTGLLGDFGTLWSSLF